MKKEKAGGKLGRAIKELRSKKGISQETRAFESELHRTYVGSAERGERNISINNIGRIADGMGAGAWPPPRGAAKPDRRAVMENYGQ